MKGAQETRWRVSEIRRIDYDLISVADVFDPAEGALLSMGRAYGSRRFVVIDECVYHHHGARLRACFAECGIDAHIVVFPGGEASKTMDAWLGVLRELDTFPIHRRDEPIVAIGGGVLTDVVGFAASSYRRGIPHIKVPTTLMGYIDASVGIKTGINFNGHKNRIGSFEPPRRVLLDRSLLRTLPRRHLCNGVCEIVKLAVIKDAELFDLLEQFGAAGLETAFQGACGGEILDRAIFDMLEELAPNLYEDDLARKADFGHTFSYGLETRHAGRLLHGEAVLLDILASTVIAQQRGLLIRADANRILALIERLAMAPAIELLDAELMWKSLLDRTLHRNGLQRVPLPVAIGECQFVDDIAFAEIEVSIRILQDWKAAVHA